ncbi:hypothetical protein LCGC14_0791160 [marine sediment metagenome]|uniref:Uncharacterized protein n=1 Tax=marine sediment metagenome TaxID=412755 RepID=A0A0F9PWU7_9ZZZZ
MEEVKDETAKLDEEGYSCGDCEKLVECRSKGKNEYGFICSEFKQ